MPGFKINGQGDGPSSTVEAARLHRWAVTFTGTSISEDTMFYAKTINRPVLEIDEIKIHHQQTEIYLPGKHRWGAITVEFYEVLTGAGNNQTSTEIFNYWSESVIDIVNNNVVDLKTIQDTRMTITTQDGLGESIADTVLESVWPTKVEPTELNYAVTELSTTKVTFRFDASYVNPGKG